MTLNIRKLHPTFGAEISGLDLSRPLDAALKREIVDAMGTHRVCVYRDTRLDDDSHIAFTRIFGEPQIAYRPKGPGDSMRRLTKPELFDAGNLDPKNNILADDDVKMRRLGDRLWHTDSSFMPVRSSYSLLLAHEIPKNGGQTWFADTVTAYEDLPQAMKDRIESLEAGHSYLWSRKLAGMQVSEEEIDAQPVMRHRIVQVHKPTGRKTLYIASHAKDIYGMPKAEGRALIKELIEFATQPKYVFSISWNVGDLANWDNLATMHRGGDYDIAKERRDMRRTSVIDAAA